MTESNGPSLESSTARGNHLTVALRTRTGTSRVLSDPASTRDAVEAVKRAHREGGVRILNGRT